MLHSLENQNLDENDHNDYSDLEKIDNYEDFQSTNLLTSQFQTIKKTITKKYKTPKKKKDENHTFSEVLLNLSNLKIKANEKPEETKNKKEKPEENFEKLLITNCSSLDYSDSNNEFMLQNVKIFEQG
jgi:hypothetical protein